MVELEPIIVDRAPPRALSPPAGLFRVPTRERDDAELDADLWNDTRLYEYSQLHQRYQGEAQTRQVGFAPQ
jgi:hypothetical protein